MRKYIYIFSAFVSACLSACSNISEDERLIYIPLAEVERNILIEDFTGQNCVNCPLATVEIEKMKEAYGEEHVVAVAIHSGPFGLPESRNGLMNDTGKEYWNKWFDNSTPQPVAIINRYVTSSDYPNWAKPVADLLSVTTDVQINASAVYLPEQNKVEVSYRPTASKNRKVNVQVWLTEDGIVARQTMPASMGGGTNREYVHNHVFRAALNGTWGVDMTIGPSDTNDGMLRSDVECDSKWNPQHLNAVVIVSDDIQVLQVVSVPVKAME